MILEHIARIRASRPRPCIFPDIGAIAPIFAELDVVLVFAGFLERDHELTARSRGHSGTFGAHSGRSTTMTVTAPMTRNAKINVMGARNDPVT